MKLKGCKHLTVPPLSIAQMLEDGDFDVEPIALPPGARVVALAHSSPDILIFYTIDAQGLPQADVDKLVRLAVRKGMYLTEKEAADGLEEHGLHQYGAARLTALTEEQYKEMATWLRSVEVVVGGATPPASSL